MDEKDKQLLLKDLCARLPYRVKLGFENSDLILVPTDFNLYTMQLSTNQIYPKSNSVAIGHVYDIWSYCPYLRPMSSMTDEEENEYMAINCYEGLFPCNEEALDYVLEHHFDYRGLIEKSLAIVAPEDMYKNK